MKLLKYLIILIAASVVSSGQPPDRFPPIMATPAEARMLMVQGGVPVAGSTYLLSEDFEGGSSDCYSGSSDHDCNNTWTITGTITTDFNFATSPAPMDGSQSLKISASENGGVEKTFTETDPVYVFLKMSETTKVGGNDSFKIN
jgi:hypothetical protein